MSYVCLVALAYLVGGISLGWLPPTLQKHKNSNDKLSFNDEDCSWMISTQYVGILIGCLLLTVIADTFGRNAVIATSVIAALVSWVGVAVTKRKIMHMVLRLVSGTSLGLNMTIISVYIGENSSPNVRGIFNSGTALFFDAGMLLGCTITTFYSYEMSAYIFIAISLVTFSSTIFLREPAQHLLTKKRYREAENQFFWLRGRNEDTEKEFDDIKTSLAAEKPRFSFAFVLDRHCQIVCAMSMLIFLTGFPALISLMSLILLPTKQFSTNELAILSELLQLIGAITSPFIIDCFGRRTLWMVSAISIAVIHFFIAALYYARETNIEIPIFEWLLFGLITAYVTIVSVAMYPLGMIMRAELFPQRFRTMGVSIACVLNALTGSIVGYFFLLIAANFGIQINFIGYAVSSLIILVLSYLYVPETKGMALTDIEKMLENQNKETR